MRKIKKPGTVDKFRQAKELLDRYPQIFVKGYMIMGFPLETIAQMRDTVNVATELAFHWYPLQILTPLPNSDITLEMLEQGLISEEEIRPRFLGEAAGSKSKEGGSLRQREQQEKIKAKHFENFFETKSDNDFLNAQELRDMWFIIDYKINYQNENRAHLLLLLLILLVNDPMVINLIK